MSEKQQSDPTTLLGSLLKQSNQKADSSALWQAIQEEFGGASGFARELKLVYDECQEGGAQKVRMLSLMLETHNKAADSDADTGSLGEFTTEELEAALRAAAASGLEHIQREAGS